jgi:alanine racemase
MAVIDLGAVERNCATLAAGLGEGTELCAVVKANGYGHGMVECAEAALRGGASVLAVAASTEAFELRERLPDARILIMGALTAPELDVALQARAEIAVSREWFLDAVRSRAGEFGVRPRLHVKLDTGMGRLGEPEPEVVSRMLATATEDERVELAALWTHFATADEEHEGYLREQLRRFRELADAELERHPGLSLHAANSAATLRGPEYHFDMVRCGVAVYGMDPFGVDAAAHGLEPVMSLHSYVADVKRFATGQSAGYGRSWVAPGETMVGVIPIGYGDGVRRGLSNRFEVLVDGRRAACVGTISMDNLTVELWPGAEAERGAPAVLLGAQGEEAVTAEEWAQALGTINYEVTCGISPRVPRAFRR